MTKKLTSEEKKKRKDERNKSKAKVEAFTGIREESAGELDLKVDLTDKEKMDASQKLALVTRELSQEKLNKAEVMKNFSAKIAKLEAGIQEFATMVNDGFKFAYVKCIRRFNFKEGKKYLIRIDTGEIIDQEKISDEERQEKLNLEEIN
jgi:hypothetical protein